MRRRPGRWGRGRGPGAGGGQAECGGRWRPLVPRRSSCSAYGRRPPRGARRTRAGSRGVRRRTAYARTGPGGRGGAVRAGLCPVRGRDVGRAPTRDADGTRADIPYERVRDNQIRHPRSLTSTRQPKRNNFRGHIPYTLVSSTRCVGDWGPTLARPHPMIGMRQACAGRPRSRTHDGAPLPRRAAVCSMLEHAPYPRRVSLVRPGVSVPLAHPAQPPFPVRSYTSAGHMAPQ